MKQIQLFREPVTARVLQRRVHLALVQQSVDRLRDARDLFEIGHVEDRTALSERREHNGHFDLDAHHERQKHAAAAHWRRKRL